MTNNYELYWNTPDRKGRGKMVLGGSFGHIDDARAEAYFAIQRDPSKIIEIYNFLDYSDGSPILDAGIVKVSKGQVIYVDPYNKRYLLRKDGRISKL